MWKLWPLTCSFVKGTFCNEKWRFPYPVVCELIPLYESDVMWNKYKYKYNCGWIRFAVESWILEKWQCRCACHKNNTIQSVPVLRFSWKKREDCIISFRKLSFLGSSEFLSRHLELTDYCLVLPPQSNAVFINSKNCSGFAVSPHLCAPNNFTAYDSHNGHNGTSTSHALTNTARATRSSLTAPLHSTGMVHRPQAWRHW
jgi:hypothetical protein